MDAPPIRRASMASGIALSLGTAFKTTKRNQVLGHALKHAGMPNGRSPATRGRTALESVLSVEIAFVSMKRNLVNIVSFSQASGISLGP